MGMVVDLAQALASTWLYIWVVERELWPRSSWIVAQVGAAFEQMRGERMP